MKELYEFDGLIFKPYNEAKSILESEGFKVITPFEVKNEFMKHLPTIEMANEWNFDCNIEPKTKAKIAFNRIVVKDTRGSGSGNRSAASSWETMNSFMDWRSGSFYKWYK